MTIETPVAVTLADLNGDGVEDVVTGARRGQAAPLSYFIADVASRPLTPEVDLTTQEGARAALTLSNQLTELISGERAVIGASFARLETSIRGLHSTTEGEIQARSRIVDADVAVEASELIRSQLTSQIATSILAQANVQPRLALELLRN